MAVLDVATTQTELLALGYHPGFDNLGNIGFNVNHGLSDTQFNELYHLKTRLGIRMQQKRSGTGIRCTFYGD